MEPQSVFQCVRLIKIHFYIVQVNTHKHACSYYSVNILNWFSKQERLKGPLQVYIMVMRASVFIYVLSVVSDSGWACGWARSHAKGVADITRMWNIDCCCEGLLNLFVCPIVCYWARWSAS